MEEKSNSEAGELTTPRSVSSQGEKDKENNKHKKDKHDKEKKHKEKKEKKEKKDKKSKKEDKPLPDVVPISDAQRSVSYGCQIIIIFSLFLTNNHLDLTEKYLWYY